MIYLDKNYGYAALQEIPLYQQVRKKFYVYTDPDVVPSEICPDDFMNVFYQVLKKYPFIQKVGFSLKINDLPDHFEAKEKVIEWESQFYVKEKEPNHYIADIDTTFALHRPYSLISVNARIMNKHLRMGPPFEAYHMPWYNNTSNLSEEEKYYIKHVEIGTHWSKGLGQENIIKDFPLKRMIKKIMGIRHE